MGNVIHDDNWRPGLLGESSAGDSTPIPIHVDPVTNRLLVDSRTTTYAASDFEGGPVTVGVVPVELSLSSGVGSILISSDSDNTGIVYIGGSNVSSDGDNAMVRLDGGDSIGLDYDPTANSLYAVGNATGLLIYILALK